MASRLKLQEKLETISTNVYFQPPPTCEMKYPCIKYTLSDKDVKYANNGKYINMDRYTITVIDEDPDSELPDKLEVFPLCQFDRSYPADDLNHWVFNLYF